MNTTSTPPAAAEAPAEGRGARADQALSPQERLLAAEAFARVIEQQGRAMTNGEASGGDQDTRDTSQGGDVPGLAPFVPWAPGAAVLGAMAAAPSTAAAPIEPAWSQISDYVERLLVGAGKPGVDAPQALFTLRSELLHETSAALTRVDNGWVLRIQSDDARMRGADMQRQEEALRDRFARRGLGEIRIEHGELPFALR
jgi:hypothetical protein